MTVRIFGSSSLVMLWLGGEPGRSLDVRGDKLARMTRPT